MTRSGIEMIEDMAEQIALLNRRSQIMEQNIKELLNRSNGVVTHKTPAQVSNLAPTTLVPARRRLRGG